jgi:hypothetical protein
MLGRDGIAGLVCLALAGAMLVLSFQIPQPPLLPVRPAFYPQIILGVMAVLGIGLVVEDILARRRGARPAARAPRAHGRVLLTFVVFALYLFVLPEIGFRLATFVFVAALQIALDPPRTLRDWGRTVLVALATVAVTYLVFERYLYVLLPRGRLTDF